MKQLFKNKFVEVSLVKGFVFGVGLNDSNTTFFVFLGPIVFDFSIPKKKSLNE